MTPINSSITGYKRALSLEPCWHWLFITSRSLLHLVLQLCSTLCDPTDRNSSGSSVHGDSPGKNTGVGCPPPEKLPDPRIEPRSPSLQVDSLPFEPPGKTSHSSLWQNFGQRAVSFIFLAFPWLIATWSIFSYFCRLFIDFSVNLVCSYPLSVFWLGCLSFCYWFEGAFMIWILCYIHWEDHSPVCGWSSHLCWWCLVLNRSVSHSVVSDSLRPHGL